MKNLFNLDAPIFRFLSRVMDVAILSLLWILCSLPVLTIGASTAALYYVTLKMVKDEDSGIVASFFRAFKDNLGQGVLLSLVAILGAAVLAADIYILFRPTSTFELALRVVITVVAIYYLCILAYAFPLQARFKNTVWATLRNAAMLAIMKPVDTIFVTVLNLAPVAVFLTSVDIMFYTLPAWIFLAPGGIAYFCSKRFVKIFDAIIKEKGLAGQEPESGTDDKA